MKKRFNAVTVPAFNGVNKNSEEKTCLAMHALLEGVPKVFVTYLLGYGCADKSPFVRPSQDTMLFLNMSNTKISNDDRPFYRIRRSATRRGIFKQKR